MRPAEISRRIYRWSPVELADRASLKALQARLGALPRAGVGMLAEELDPATRQAHRAACGARTASWSLPISTRTAESPSRFGKIAGVPTIGRDEFMPRSGCPVLLVDLNGRLGVRKEFRNSRPVRAGARGAAASRSRGLPGPAADERRLGQAARSRSPSFPATWSARCSPKRARTSATGRRTAPTRAEVEGSASATGASSCPRVLSDRRHRDVAAGARRDPCRRLRARGREVREHHPEGAEAASRSSSTSSARFRLRRLPPWLADHLRQIDVRKFREHFGAGVPMNALRHSFAKPGSARNPRSGESCSSSTRSPAAAPSGSWRRCWRTRKDRLSEYDIALAVLDDGPRAFALPDWLEDRPAGLQGRDAVGASRRWIARSLTSIPI